MTQTAAPPPSEPPSGPPGGRPPWWPEGEPFPGHGRPPWARSRRGSWRFRPFGAYFLVFVFVVAAIGTTAAWLVGNVLGLHPADPALRVGSALVLLFLLFLGGGSGRFFRRVARPVTELVDAAHRIEDGDLTARVGEHGPRDLRSVAHAFNAMSDALQASDDRRRQFLADVTHELRTPLSVIRGRAEGIIDGVYPGDAEHVSPVLDAARTLELLIEDLRTLALAEAGGLTLHREPVDLGVLINETLTMAEEGARSRGVRFQAQLEEMPPLQADPARLQSVLSNLVSNAVRHSPASGTVTVSARAVDDGAEVAVTDAGPGIPDDLLPHVFDRFVKGTGSAGSGLGLAIARDLVVAHGGRIRAANIEGGGGQVVLWIPSFKGL